MPPFLYTKLSSALFIIAMVVFSSTAIATPVKCNGQYFNDQAPNLESKIARQRFSYLCFTEFATGYSGIVKTPLWSAEHLTRARINKAHSIHRKGHFYEDHRLPEADRSTLSDYHHSGYDRGHMAPAADFDSYKAEGESFSLANVLPQNRWDNRNLWAWIESATRYMAVKKGDIYVISGPIFAGRQTRVIHNRLYVPAKLFKIVYDPSTNKAGAYLVENRKNKKYQVVSVSRIESMTGINFLPWMSQSEKRQVMELPVPENRWRH